MDSGSHNRRREKDKRCSVASPEATKKPDFKTWGKARSLRLPDFDYASP